MLAETVGGDAIRGRNTRAASLVVLSTPEVHLSIRVMMIISIFTRERQAGLGASRSLDLQHKSMLFEDVRQCISPYRNTVVFCK